jgi:hypothetical protein
MAPAVLALAIAGIAAIVSGATAAEPATTRVSYLAGGSVYLEAGRKDGLAEGDTLEAVSDGRTVARLIVRYLSTGRAVCDTLSAVRMPAVGDAVRYRARPVPTDPGARPAAGDTAGTTTALPGIGAGTQGAHAKSGSYVTRPPGRLRGRIGARYLAVDPKGAGGYSQPGLELRLDGANVAGSPIDVAVDVRGRRTHHSAAGVADDGEARVYRLAGTVHDAAGRRRLTLGRQLSSAFAAVSLFDGALVEVAGERWGAGLFSGAEPDPATWAVSGDIVQHGAFVSRRGRNGARRWSVTTGGVASFDHGQVNRQYGFVQGSWLEPKLSLFLAEEFDLNTGWKRALGEPTLSLTNTFLSARAQVTRDVSVNAGYDNRRTVRLYRDRETPETEFDDRHRQGAWAGVAADVVEHVRMSADGRWSGGGAGDHHSQSGSLEAYRLSALQADARWRSTRFDGATSQGWMHVAGIGVRPWGQTRIELSAGSRITTDVLSQLHTRTRWEGADLDLGFASRWYLLLAAQHDHGDGFDAMLWHASLSRMF